MLFISFFILIKPFIPLKFHSNQFLCSVGGGRVILKKTTPIRIEEFPHRIKGLKSDLHWMFLLRRQVRPKYGSKNASQYDRATPKLPQSYPSITVGVKFSPVLFSLWMPHMPSPTRWEYSERWLTFSHLCRPVPLGFCFFFLLKSCICFCNENILYCSPTGLCGCWWTVLANTSCFIWRTVPMWVFHYISH